MLAGAIRLDAFWIHPTSIVFRERMAMDDEWVDTLTPSGSYSKPSAYKVLPSQTSFDFVAIVPQYSKQLRYKAVLAVTDQKSKTTFHVTSRAFIP
jgi:hypothetical protein